MGSSGLVEVLDVQDPAGHSGELFKPRVDRLDRKGGREVMARCPTGADADAAAAWLVDRVSRLQPGLKVTTEIESGGGQFLLVLRA